MSRYAFVKGQKPTRRARTRDIDDLLATWPKIVDYTGLSEYESKVYLSLLSLGSSGARRLSLHCRVPRTKVYGTLRKLIDNGPVVEIPGSPKVFTPSNPAEAFEALLDDFRRKALDFDEVLQALTRTHENKREEARPRKKIVWYIEEEGETKRKCLEMIGRSQRSLTILTNEDGLGLLFNSAHRLLDENNDRGIRVTLHSPLDPRTSALARELSYVVQVNKVDFKAPVIFINSDDEQFLLARIASKEEAHFFEDSIFSGEEELLALFSITLLEPDRRTRPGEND
jgi:sugar-specific transcriptional regulator TrmB